MGLANLVPGISGGTMILAIGLYDRFIGAIADVTRLRIRKDTILFLMALGAGLAAAVLLLSGVAVQLVSQHRWAMYALFIGMTLGGAPELLQRMKPVRLSGGLAFVIGLCVMIWFALQSGKTQLEPNVPTLLAVGAIGASSMILPGISGSYVLLILGMYDTVIGALSISEVRVDPMASLMIIGPVVVGAAAGIALLSNILKAVLSRFSGPSHGALLGLLVGSVLGLYPFREAVHPELSHRPTRKAIEEVVIKDKSVSEVAAATSALSQTDLEQHAQVWRGKTKGEMKSASLELRRFDPTGRHIGSALGLFVLGVFLTRLLGRKPK
ncbi:MAG: putative membrane protein [Planctomycetota bacterium]|jgi:putative membrane protein